MTLFNLPPVAVEHPAPYPPEVLHLFDRLLRRHGNGQRLRVLDPFAGTGRVHRLDHDTTGVEIQQRWARWHPRTLVGDATCLPFKNEAFHVVVESVTYGNRMADLYDGRDGSERHTYRIAHGEPLHPRNTGGMQWGPKYRELHLQAHGEAFRVLKPAGLMLLNVSDHIRGGETIYVTAWHARALADVGFRVEPEWVPVPTRGLTHGANYETRTSGEWIIAAYKPEFEDAGSGPWGGVG